MSIQLYVSQFNSNKFSIVYLFLFALKAMAEAKYESATEKAKATVEKVAAVCLTSNMLTSIT